MPWSRFFDLLRLAGPVLGVGQLPLVLSFGSNRDHHFFGESRLREPQARLTKLEAKTAGPSEIGKPLEELRCCKLLTSRALDAVSRRLRLL